MASTDRELVVDVVYALPDRHSIVTVQLPPGATVRDAVIQSGLLERLGLDIERCAVGVFGERIALDTPVEQGARVEIYRPLVADPKETRRRRAAKRRATA